MCSLNQSRRGRTDRGVSLRSGEALTRSQSQTLSPEFTAEWEKEKDRGKMDKMNHSSAEAEPENIEPLRYLR